MYLVQRTATLKGASYLPKAAGWSKELCGYVNKTYPGFNLRFGVEMFNQMAMHWFWESDTLAKLDEVNAKLMTDQKYWAMVESGKDFWVEGSGRDKICNVM